MKHLLKREDYIREHIHINNTKNIGKQNELYEGLLSSIFGGLKMLLKKDWENIKCKNPTVLEYLKEIDKSLNGYTMIKMQYSNECVSIRQNVADYFNDILDYKLSQIEDIENKDDANEFIERENVENKEHKGVEKILNIKDDTILDNIKSYKENISTLCKVNSKLREYADQLLNSVTVFVNDIIIKELEKKGVDRAKIDKKRKKLEEEEKRLEEIRKKMNELSQKADEKSLKKIKDERDDAFVKLDVKPISSMSGDKAIDVISKQFKDMLGEFDNSTVNESILPKEYVEIFRSDTYVGIQKSIDDINWNFSKTKQNTPEGVYGKFIIKVILNKINTVFKVILNNKNMFKDVPSASVQAMMVSLSNAVIYGFVGDNFDIKNNDAILSLMTKCAIDSDATIGFNLPLIDPEKPDNGNFFTSIMNQFKNVEISSKEVENIIKHTDEKEIEKIIKYWGKNKGKIKDKSEFIKQFGSIMMKDFRQNMNELFDIILKKANELKDKAKEEREKNNM